MHLAGNPIQRRGERNIHCPHYNDCLDHAAKSFWQHFSCSECPNRSVRRSITNSFDDVNYPVTSYEIPPNIFREIR